MPKKDRGYKLEKRNDKQGSRIAPHEGGSGVPYTLEYPTISFRFLDKDYGLDECDQEEMASLAKKISKITATQWNELQKAKSHGIGCETIKFHKIPPTKIPSIATGPLIAFRFHALKPMLGFREGAVYYVLFIDPKMELYTH